MGSMLDVLYGTMGEYVFASQNAVSAPDSNLLSQLDWDMKPVVMAGLKLEMTLPYSITAAFRFAGALPMTSGGMVNRDWLAGDNRLNPNDPESPTHYSEHTNYLLGGYTSDVSVGYRFYSYTWHIKPMIGFKAHYFTFDGRDGFGNYPSGDMRFYGTVISYRQYYRIPYIGLAGGWRHHDRGSIGITTRYSPFVYADAIDHHYTRRLEFFDFLKKGMYWDIAIRSELSLNRGFTPWLEIGWQGTNQFIGDTTILNSETGQKFNRTDSAGASLRLLRLSAGISLQTAL